MLGSYRTDDLHRRHPLRPVVAELLRLPNVTPIDLGPLEPVALAAHIAALAELSRRRGGLDATELIRIVDRAEGNAYYAEELLAASDGDEELPPGLAAVLMTRVEQLSGTAQQALRAAAVSGRRVDDELVMAASGLSAPEYEEAIREAVAHQLLAPDGQEGYMFRHALLREAIYADLLLRRADQVASRRWPACCPMRSGWTRCLGPTRSWLITAWPATTSPARSPRRSGPGRRPNGWRRRPRRTGTTTRRWRCGIGWTSRKSWAGWTGSGSPSGPPPTPPPAATSRARWTSCAGSARRRSARSRPILAWSARSTSGSRSTCCSSRWRPTPPRPPGRPSTPCRRSRRPGNGRGPRRPTPTCCCCSPTTSGPVSRPSARGRRPRRPRHRGWRPMHW